MPGLRRPGVNLIVAADVHEGVVAGMVPHGPPHHAVVVALPGMPSAPSTSMAARPAGAGEVLGAAGDGRGVPGRVHRAAGSAYAVLVVGTAAVSRRDIQFTVRSIEPARVVVRVRLRGTSAAQRRRGSAVSTCCTAGSPGSGPRWWSFSCVPTCGSRIVLKKYPLFRKSVKCRGRLPPFAQRERASTGGVAFVAPAGLQRMRPTDPLAAPQ